MEPAGLAVIVALAPEASPVRRQLCRRCREVAPAVGRLWRGRIGAHRVMLLRCGMGEDRAAAALQWLRAREPLWGVLSLGFAGGLQPGLATGDVVLADRIQAVPDLAMSAARLHEAACVVPDARLASLAAAAAQRAHLSRHHGLLLSHHTLVAGVSDKSLLGRHTGALAVDMESYRIASLAAAHRLPFISMRAILDPCDMQLDLPPDGLTTPGGGVLPGAAALAVVRQPGLLVSFWHLWRRSRLAQDRLAVWLRHFFALLDTTPSEEEPQRP